MNDASQWRLEVARSVTPIISKNPKVQAIMLAGSASRGHADSYSDIEIGVFWSEPPTEQDRMNPIERTGGVFSGLDSYDPRDYTWIEEWGLGGVKMDIRNMTLDGLETIMREVLEQGKTAELKQTALSAIQHSIPLYNQPLIEQWKTRAAVYPDLLARAMVQENFRLDSWCWWVELFNHRGDIPLAYAAFGEITRRMLAILMGLNRIYHPGFKWMHRLINEMVVKPDHLEKKIRQSFQTEPQTALAILRDLMLEIYDLIDAHMPNIETAEAREAFLKLRPQVVEMPEVFRAARPS